MDDDGFRNWGYYEPAATTFKGNLGLQLMSTMDRPGRDPNLVIGSYHNQQESPINKSYNWINQQKDKFFNILPVTTTSSYSNVLPETSSAPVKLEDEIVETKKRKSKAKKPKDHENKNKNVTRVKTVKKSVDLVINGVSMDISELPVPICTCTGASQQCYRWGCGGWQSACCTTNISMYPLPMSTKRRGARISGRKMSQGAFKKVLERLASDGFDFGSPIDLKSYWARHGTNKFVIIR